MTEFLQYYYSLTVFVDQVYHRMIHDNHDHWEKVRIKLTYNPLAIGGSHALVLFGGFVG